MQNPIPLEEGRALFGRNTEIYQEGRPDYPERVYDLLKKHCGSENHFQAFEIGPGTAQATEKLLNMGYQVTAIEPDPNLVMKLNKRLEGYPQNSFTLVHSTFEDAKLPTSYFDLGIAATSFHWVDPAKGLEKVFQLLRSGGWFAMWWTVFGDPTNMDAFMQKTNHLFAPLSTSPSHKAGYRHPYPLQKDERINDLTKSGFTEILSEEIRWASQMDVRRTIQLVSTFSPVARLNETERATFLCEIERIINNDFGGTVKRNFVTAIYLARKPE